MRVPARKPALAAPRAPHSWARRSLRQIESVDSLPHLGEIVAAADGVMVARGDLGAQVPIEDVPSLQARAASACGGAVPPGLGRYTAPAENCPHPHSALLTPPTHTHAPTLPLPQKEIVMRCRQQGKPVIIASHLLQSMHTAPTPTRAEVRAGCKRRGRAAAAAGAAAAGLPRLLLHAQLKRAARLPRHSCHPT